MRRYVLYAIGLMVAWVMLWDRVSIANIAAGLLVATAILFAFPLHREDERERRVIRPIPLTRLALSILRDLAVSNFTVALLIVSRKQELHSGVIACPMRSASSKSLSTIANIIALSPGTMAVDAVAQPPTLFIHVLTLDDPQSMRSRVSRLELLVINALGSATEREAVAVDAGGAP